jgi:signal transduction histidine kinase
MRSALQVVAREMVQLFTIKHTAIALLNKGRNRLKIVAEYNREEREESTIGMTFNLNDSSASCRVIEEQRTVIIDQGSMESPGEPLNELLQHTGTHSLMIVPLLARGEVVGTIDIGSSDINRDFSPAEVELAETIAGQIAGAIDNARLFSLMQEAKETAEAANAAKSDFLANVSHELRTPLTSVMGFARIVKKRLQERIFSQLNEVDSRTQKTIEQIDQNLDIIVAEGERLTEMINNVLDLSKIEAGKIEWQIQPVRISEVIEHAAAATIGLLEQKGDLELATEVPADLPLVLGDRNRLIQVIINLISNAVKFTARGTITCKVQELDDEILVQVSDTGIGIAFEDQSRVFEKFTQLGDTLTEKPQGTGLGLPITREIVERHGGRIWMDSASGRGSTFFFTLPVYKGGSVSSPAENQTISEKARYGISSND